MNLSYMLLAMPAVVAQVGSPSGLSVKDWDKLAESKLNQKDWKALESISTQFSTEHPKEGKAWGYLGISLVNMERSTEAEAALSKGIALDPSFLGNWFNLALIRAQIGKPVDSIVYCLDHLAETSPGKALALLSNDIVQKALIPLQDDTLDLGKVSFQNHPKPVWKKVPPYPTGAKLSRIQGSVWIEILVDKSGRVVQISNPSGPKELTPVAPYCAVQFRFPPLIREGVPRAYKMLYEIPFKLR